jgi:hypothetical protein
MITEEQKKLFHMPSIDNGNELIFAARRNDLEAVKYLMNTEFEYFSRIQEYKKEQAFILAAGDGHLDIIKYFIDEFPKEINLPQKCNEALRCAVQEGAVESAKFLLTDAKTKDYARLDCMYCFNLAPKHMLEYLVFDYKMDIRPYIERIKKDYYLMQDRSKQFVPGILNRYEKFVQAQELYDSLSNEGNNSKRMKI